MTSLLICSHHGTNCHPIALITPFPVSSVYRATPKLDLKGLTSWLSPIPSDYTRFPACALDLACSISPFPLPTLVSSSRYSQSPASSSCPFPHPLLLAPIVPTLAFLPLCEYIFLQIATLAWNLPNHLEDRRDERCLFVDNFGVARYTEDTGKGVIRAMGWQFVPWWEHINKEVIGEF